MKKIILILIIFILITGCNINNNDNLSLLMNYNDYKDIDVDNVTSLEIVKYLEDGVSNVTIDNYDDIIKIYNDLNKYYIGNETNRTCEDSTVIYKFIQDDKIISIKIECNDVLVLDNIRRELIK